jgi:hypothetical protein
MMDKNLFNSTKLTFSFMSGNRNQSVKLPNFDSLLFCCDAEIKSTILQPVEAIL